MKERRRKIKEEMNDKTNSNNKKRKKEKKSKTVLIKTKGINKNKTKSLQSLGDVRRGGKKSIRQTNPKEKQRGNCRIHRIFILGWNHLTQESAAPIGEE